MLKWVFVVVALVVVYLIVTRLVPRWWGNVVSGVVDSRITVGWLFGVFIGFVFTALPLVVLWLGFRVRGESRTWRGWLGWLAAAAVTALPNLMTLGIVAGSSTTAERAEQKLNTGADGFRAGTVLGVVLGVAAALFVGYLVRTRGMFKDQNRRLRDRTDDGRG